MKINHTERFNEQDHKSLVFWATDCAERVLSHFEENHPNDSRPRKALEAGRAWGRGEIAMSEARVAAFAAHAAARDSQHASARAAARAAGHAAATAHVASHARHAAAYAVSAATVANDANDTTERDWQFQRLAKHLQSIVFPNLDSSNLVNKQHNKALHPTTYSLRFASLVPRCASLRLTAAGELGRCVACAQLDSRDTSD